jgi:hypothetical protein
VPRLIRKVWTSIGAVSLATVAGTGSAQSQHTHSQIPAASPPAKDQPPGVAGGMAKPQSGETYLTDGGPRDPRIRIYRDIALMRGHILVGTELVDAEKWDDALPHFLHPTEELYGAMERYIKLHKVTPFDKQLKALAQAVKARNKPAFGQAAKLVEARLTNALSAFRRFMTGQPFSSYTMRTAAEVLKVAKGEYGQAIENGRITKSVEFQDSRGFVWYAEQLLAEQEAALAKIDKMRLAEIKLQMAALKSAWPTVVPPEHPVISSADLDAKVDALTALLERYF